MTDSNFKCDRALELHEKGIPSGAICERLGITPKNLMNYLIKGRARAAKPTEEAKS